MNILNLGYDSANYYLLEPESAGLLVDIGWPGSLPRLLNVLKRKGLAFQKIKYLFCTHYHPDHAGLAQELKERGIRLVVLDNQFSGLAGLGAYMKPANNFQPITVHGNLKLKPEESRAFLGSIGLAGELIPSPGHSEDSVSLVLDDGLAFTGDALTPMQPEESQNLAAVLMNALRSRGVRTIYPGHGPAIQLHQ